MKHSFLFAAFLAAVVAVGSTIACGGGDSDSGDDDDDDDGGTASWEDRCVLAMERLFGAEGCAQPELYSAEDIDGFCAQTIDVADDDECKRSATETMIIGMEEIDCADATASYHTWTDGQIAYNDALNAC